MNVKLLYNKISLILVLTFIPIGISNAGVFSSFTDIFKKKVSLHRVENLRLRMIEKRDPRAMVKLISIFKNRNEPYNVRIEALRALAESRHPDVILALQEAISDNTMIELDLMLESIDMLAQFGHSESSDAFISGLKTTESKIMAIREAIISAIGKSGTEDEIMTLIDLYEISKTNYSRMDKLLSIALGGMDDRRVMPILMEIASNEEVNIDTRISAVNVLAKKQAPELVDYFIELLGDPTTKHKLNEYTLAVMGEIDNERMITALLESYNVGKSEYHVLLNTVLKSFEDYQDPGMIPLLTEIAESGDLPDRIREKAIVVLSKYNDDLAIEAILGILEDPYNYKFYYAIMSALDDLGGYDKYKDRIREASHQAIMHHQEIK